MTIKKIELDRRQLKTLERLINAYKIFTDKDTVDASLFRCGANLIRWNHVQDPNKIEIELESR